jgi:hypothetical protein
MGVWQSYRLRLQRKRWLIRAFRKRRELAKNVDRTHQIQGQDILLFCTQRNEMTRLPHFLAHYRDLGVAHFLFVDNGSTDGSLDYLTSQPDVSVWSSGESYKRARFGMDWMNWLLRSYGHGHWCLTVDPDELLVFPFCDTRPLRALTDWLDASSIRTFSAMLLDMYPKGPVDRHVLAPGQDPIKVARWFDPGNYRISLNKLHGNLWIQGGPRERIFFQEQPHRAPALNKIPLVRWDRRYAYVSSTHNLLPRGLNHVFDAFGGEKTSGILLHPKFVGGLSGKATEELTRKQHFGGSKEYRAYAQGLAASADIWCEKSERFSGWRQLESLGLMSSGNWA